MCYAKIPMLEEFAHAEETDNVTICGLYSFILVN